MNKFSYSDIDRLAMTCIPPYPAPDLLQNMVAFHRNLSKHITPLYVFDGIAPSLKDVTRDKRDMTREAAGKDWEKMVNKVIQRDDAQLSEEEMQKATASRMGMKKPNPVDHAAILKWMKEENILCCGSLLEADQQMVKLEKDGIVEGIITEDGDIVGLGARRVLCKYSRKTNGEYQFQYYDRDIFMQSYNSKVNKCPTLTTDLILLLGNDYHKRTKKTMV